MSEGSKKLAARSAEQAKHSANNAGRAVEAAAEEIVEKAGASANALFIQAAISGIAAIALGIFSSQRSIAAQKAAVREQAAQHANVTLTTRGRKVG